MAWETRHGKGRYFTLSRRKNGRVVREYYGTGDDAELVAKIVELQRAAREAQAVVIRKNREAMQAVETKVVDLCRFADSATRAALEANGYHQHHRGTWRKRRGDKRKGAGQN